MELTGFRLLDRDARGSSGFGVVHVTTIVGADGPRACPTTAPTTTATAAAGNHANEQRHCQQPGAGVGAPTCLRNKAHAQQEEQQA